MPSNVTGPGAHTNLRMKSIMRFLIVVKHLGGGLTPHMSITESNGVQQQRGFGFMTRRQGKTTARNTGTKTGSGIRSPAYRCTGCQAQQQRRNHERPDKTQPYG